MSTKNNKSLASQALLEMEQITSAIKEESKKSINILLAEAVKDALREGCNEDDEYEVIDNEEEKDANDNEEGSQELDGGEDAAEDSEKTSPFAEEAPESSEETSEVETQDAPENGEGDEWSEFSKYQVGDNAYDLTGENDYENVVKVYKLLTADDHIAVKQDGNKIQLKDDSVGTEYVIDLGDENGEEPKADVGEEMDSIQESILGPDDPDFWPAALPRRYPNQPEMDVDVEPELEVDFEDAEDDIAGFESDKPKGHKYASKRELDSLDFDNWNSLGGEDELYESKNMKNNLNVNKKARKPMKESKEVLFEVDLGYTDSYQDKDPIAGLSNDEPSKSGKSWHKGVPTGTQKPWAGNAKSKSEPFAKTISEEEVIEEPMEEATNVGGAVQQRSSSKSHIPANRKEHGPKIKRHVSAGGNYEELVAENKKLKNENKELKEAILAIRKNLSEAYVTNANLGKITKLFLENTTSQAEKIDIVNRFSNEAKTIEESNTLYESIKRELNKPVGTQLQINESMKSATGDTLNEEKAYKSNDVLKTIDFMNRVLKY